MAGATFEVQVQQSPELKAMVAQAERLIERVASMTPAQLAEMRTGKLFLESHQRAEKLATLGAALVAKLPRCPCGCGALVGDSWRDEATALEAELAAQRAAVEAMRVEAAQTAPIALEPQDGAR